MKTLHFLQLTSYCWLVLMLYWFFAGMHTKITVKKEASASRILYLLLMMTAFGMVYEPRLKIGLLGEKFISPNDYVEWTGLIVTLISVCFAIAARWKLGENWSGRVTVKKDHQLVQSGPYAFTRHPIYTGIFFGLAGAVIIEGEIRGLIALLVLFISLQLKIAREEKFMKQVFPGYREYAKRTKKIIPLVY